MYKSFLHNINGNRRKVNVVLSGIPQLIQLSCNVLNNVSETYKLMRCNPIFTLVPQPRCRIDSVLSLGRCFSKNGFRSSKDWSHSCSVSLLLPEYRSSQCSTFKSSFEAAAKIYYLSIRSSFMLSSLPMLLFREIFET